MIKKLNVQNFQSHKTTELEFDPGVNVIIGATDSGKTAIIRALRWLMFNRPSGDDFRSNWGGDTIIDLDLDNGQVARLRTKDFNGYVLGMHDEFAAIKTEIPQEIQQTLNINEINIQRQHDAPFLISETAGSVAEFFNRIAGLDKIDSGLQNINRWIREIDQSLKYQREDLEKLQEEIKRFDHLDKFEAEVEVLEILEKKVDKANRSLTQLINLQARIDELNALVSQEQETLKVEPELNEILAKIEKRESLNEKRSSLRKLVQRCLDIKKEIKNNGEFLFMEVTLDDTLSKYEERSKLDSKRSLLLLLKSDTINVSQRIEMAEELYRISLKEFNDAFPDVCPLCNQPIKR